MALGDLLAETYKEQARADVRLKSGLWLGIQFSEADRSGPAGFANFRTSSWQTYRGCAFYLCEGRPSEPWPALTRDARDALAKHLLRFVSEDLGDEIALQLFGTPPAIFDNPLRPSPTASPIRLCERPVKVPREALGAVGSPAGVAEWISNVLSANGGLYDKDEDG